MGIALAGPDCTGVVVSLDARKAFDSVEWNYLRTALCKFSFVPIDDKLSLYTQISSGIRVNWDKSLIFLYGQLQPRPDTNTPLNWVDEFRYLGISL